MTETIIVAIITGITGIMGTLLGSILSINFDRIKRRWNKADRILERKTNIIDNRCEQAENYVKEMANDFRGLMNDIGYILLISNTSDAKDRVEKRVKMVEETNNRIFALGPAITTLGDEELEKPYNGMIKQMDILQKYYINACNSRLGMGKKVDIVDMKNKINKSWIIFSRNLGNYYKRLDEIRIERTN